MIPLARPLFRFDIYPLQMHAIDYFNCYNHICHVSFTRCRYYLGAASRSDVLATVIIVHVPRRA
jgi:hypothetical protein